MRGFYSIALEPIVPPHTQSDSSHVLPGKIQQQSELESATTSAAASYSRYVNPRFKYGIDYPSFLNPGEEAENGDGLKFASADNQIELVVYGQSAYATVDGSAWTIDKVYQETLAYRKREGQQVTYKAKGKDWCVVSGRDGDKIFYSKVMIHDENVKAFELKYPAERKEVLDPVVTRIVESFKNTL